MDNDNGGEGVKNAEDGLETESTFENGNVENSTSQAPQSDLAKNDSQDDTPEETELGEHGESTQPGKEGEKEEGKKDGEEEDKTFKGTKKADDPISALNQENANYKKFVGAVEGILNDPVQLRQYLGELEAEKGIVTSQPATPAAPATPAKDEMVELEGMIDKMETQDDMKAVFKKMKEVLRGEATKGIQKAEDLEKKQLQSQQRQQFVQKVEQIGNGIRSEIDATYQKYPVLRQKNADGSANPDFDPELDKLIGETFESLDFDKKTGLYNGKVSFMKIADTIMTARGHGESAGSKRAQTTIVDKRSGRIRSGGARTPVKVDESKMSPEQIIAGRIQRMAKRVRSK